MLRKYISGAGLIGFVSIFFSHFLYAQDHNNLSSILKEAYSHVFNLEYEKARLAIVRLENMDQSEATAYALHLQNYLDFLKIFTHEDIELMNTLSDNESMRLSRLDSIQGAEAVVNFVRAEIILQWAVCEARFRRYWSAYRGATRAYSILEKNLREHPSFKLSLKSLALFHALVGAIPEKYRWGFKLLSGMEGTISQGIQELDQVIDWSAQGNFPYVKEAKIAKSYILLHLANLPDMALLEIQSAGLNIDHSPIANFIMANIYLRLGKAHQARKYLDNYIKKEPDKCFPFLYFMRGMSRIHLLDRSSREDFRHFLEYYRGQDYIKEAHQKIAWTYLLDGNKMKYHEEMDQLLDRGNQYVGGDQNAHIEASRSAPPNVALLKMRLLYDGGQCDRAHQIAEQIAISYFENEDDRIEFIYRQGRIAQCLDDGLSAIIYYNQTLLLGSDYDAYYACNAALQLGLIYEGKRDLARARQNYELCLSLKPKDYAQALHAKATAGMKRLEELRG